MGTALRWVLAPIASITAWFAALFLGLVLRGFAGAFCPADEIISDICVAPWFPAVERGVFRFSAALSAVFVVGAAFLVAPAGKVPVAWLALSIGSMVALSFARATSAWDMFAFAVIAGSLTAFLLSKYQNAWISKHKYFKDELS